MSITDELREYVDEFDRMAAMKSKHGMSFVAVRLSDIANRIDAAHERALAEQYASLTVDMKPMTDESMAEEGWVRLPMDADGEYIRVGDKLDGYKETIVVDEMALQYGSWALVSEDRRAFQCPEAFTHHKATVEDVLREFSNKVCNSGHQWGLDAADTITEFAERIREAVEHE